MAQQAQWLWISAECSTRGKCLSKQACAQQAGSREKAGILQSLLKKHPQCLLSKGPQYLLGKPLDDWAHRRHIQTIADTAVFMSMGLPAKQ